MSREDLEQEGIATSRGFVLHTHVHPSTATIENDGFHDGQIIPAIIQSRLPIAMPTESTRATIAACNPTVETRP